MQLTNGFKNKRFKLPRCWGKFEVDQLKINRYLSIEEFHRNKG